MSRRATLGISGVGLLVALAATLAFVVFPNGGQSAVFPPTGLYRVASAYSVNESSVNNATQTLWTTSTANAFKAFYVTVTGTADVHDNAVESLGCQIDGNNCAPSEFIRIQKQDADLHDNSVVARWCMILPSNSPNSHTFTIYQEGSGGTDVYIEKVLITIDAAQSGTCDEFPAVGSDAPAKAAQKSH